jgi:CRP/FNR family transcriptional regulator, cyclic AMP receptor protein
MPTSSVSMHSEDRVSCKVRKSGWFRDLSPLALAEYDTMATRLSLPKDSVLFAEGEMPSAVAVVCEGRLKLTRSSREGKTLLVRIAKPGDVLGLSSALLKIPYEVTARAIERTQIKTFRHADFLHFIQSHAEGGLHAAESLSDEYRSALNDACRLALSTSISGRMAHLLLELAVENETAHDCHPEIHMSLKHEDLASMLGSSRESITRILNDFRRKNIILIDGSRMIILRKEALEEIL